MFFNYPQSSMTLLEGRRAQKREEICVNTDTRMSNSTKTDNLGDVGR